MALKKAESTAVSEKWALDHTTDKLISAGELCEAWSWADRGHGAGERGIGRAGGDYNTQCSSLCCRLCRH